MSEQAPQAEYRLVEMKQGAIRIAVRVGQRQPGLGNMVGGLGAERGE